MAGIFDKLSEHTNLTDFVALPSPKLDISLGGEAARLCSEVERRLDLDTGELRLDYAVAASGRTVRVTERRVFPMDEPGRLHMRVSLDGEGELSLSLDTEISNSTIPDDQVKENCELTRMFRPLGCDGWARTLLNPLDGAGDRLRPQPKAQRKHARRRLRGAHEPRRRSEDRRQIS